MAERPPEPKPYFQVGDIIRERPQYALHGLPRNQMRVTRVEMYWINEWREGVEYEHESGHGAGNADFFTLIERPTPTPSVTSKGEP